MIGIGRMGASMVQRLMKGGYECVIYDVISEIIKKFEAKAAIGVNSPVNFISRLSIPPAIWLMMPAAVVDQELKTLVPQLELGDIVNNGGNSCYREFIRRGAELKAQGIHYIEVGK